MLQKWGPSRASSRLVEGASGRFPSGSSKLIRKLRLLHFLVKLHPSPHFTTHPLPRRQSHAINVPADKLSCGKKSVFPSRYLHSHVYAKPTPAKRTPEYAVSDWAFIVLRAADVSLGEWPPENPESLVRKLEAPGANVGRLHDRGAGPVTWAHEIRLGDLTETPYSCQSLHRCRAGQRRPETLLGAACGWYGVTHNLAERSSLGAPIGRRKVIVFGNAANEGRFNLVGPAGDGILST